MKAINYIWIICLGLWLGGCARDNSEVNFRDLNKVSLDGLKDKYSVMLYDHLKIPLQLTTSLSDESHLSYVWYIYTPTSRNEADTLSRERNMDVLIDPEHATPGENYTLVVKVTDETTGVYYRKEMALEVLTLFTKGTVLLCEENGNAEVDFLTPGEERTLIENIYASANNGQIVGKNPLRIFSINPNNYEPEMKQVLIMCNDENGGMVANPVTFEAIRPIRQAFFAPLTAPVLTPQLYYYPYIDYLIVDGLVYKRAVNMRDLYWDGPLVSTDGAGDYEAASFMFDVCTYTTFYDRKNNRLLWHDRNNMGGVHQIVTEDVSVFDCNDIGENMELLCFGNLSEEDNYWMLMKNSETGKLYIYTFYVDYDEETFSGTLKMEVTPQIAPHMYDAHSFAANPDYTGLLIYATAGQVYSFSLDMLTATTTTSQEATQIDLSSRNMEITGMKFVTIEVETTPEDTESSLQVRLCIRDNNLSSLKGGVEFYEISSQGGIHASRLFGKSGFCDRVVDMDEKYN